MTTPKLAILGPLGTYSHQVAYTNFGTSVEYVPYESMSHVFEATSESCSFGVLPRENSIYGSVADAHDLLRSPIAGSSIFVRQQIKLAVQHALVARSGTEIHDIAEVFSHEQALGQCSRFLSENLPNAKLFKLQSTAAAAAKVADDSDPALAAVCSPVCATLFDGLAVLQESIQNEKENHTRFFVLSTSLSDPLPGTPPSSTPRCAFVRIIPSCEPSAPSIIDLLHKLEPQFRVASIDRRAALGQSSFGSVYFVELRIVGIPQQAAEATPVVDQDARLELFKRQIQILEDDGADATLLGWWH